MIPVAGDRRHSAVTVAYGLIFVLLIPSTRESPLGCSESIVSFGDSLADTGNLIRLDRANKVPPRCSLYPYGETFFHHPTGRFSDGRLVVDFISESLGLPLLHPYFGGENENVSCGFENGANFAVAGATALDPVFLATKGIHNPTTNVSLSTQLNWFEQFLSTVPDRRRFIKNSLFLLGEIGGNDYYHSLMIGTHSDLLQELVPAVIDTIGQATEALIELGAETIIVPGNLPIGCLPVYLTQFKTDDANAYEPKTGCLNELNEFSQYHNKLLQKELARIGEIHPSVALIYADYYNAALQLYLSPEQYGFGQNNDVLTACCGGGGPYNYNKSALCGIAPSTCCEDPSAYVSWDGLHFTEATYRLIAEGILDGTHTIPPIQTICSSTSSRGARVYEH